MSEREVWVLEAHYGDGWSPVYFWYDRLSAEARLEHLQSQPGDHTTRRVVRYVPEVKP